MAEASIPDAPHRSPKGLRHGFGINARQRCAPLRGGCGGEQPCSTNLLYPPTRMAPCYLLTIIFGMHIVLDTSARDLGRGELRFDDLAVGTAGDFLDRHDDPDQEKTR